MRGPIDRRGDVESGDRSHHASGKPAAVHRIDASTEAGRRADRPLAVAFQQVRHRHRPRDVLFAVGVSDLRHQGRVSCDRTAVLSTARARHRRRMAGGARVHAPLQTRAPGCDNRSRGRQSLTHRHSSAGNPSAAPRAPACRHHAIPRSLIGVPAAEFLRGGRRYANQSPGANPRSRRVMIAERYRRRLTCR